MKNNFFHKILTSTMLIFFVMRANAGSITIMVSNFQFTPASATINLGDTVRWIWVNGTHTTTSQFIPLGATPWNSNITSANKSFFYVPTVLGTYNYRCNIHPASMLGSFDVVCPTPSVMIMANGPTTFCKGGSVDLTAFTQGAVSYQWRKGGVPIPNATSSSYTVTGIGKFDYTVNVTNGCGMIGKSNVITVNVQNIPNASITPQDTVNKCTNQFVTLTANGGTNLTYQWKRFGNNVPGATQQTLTTNKAGSYKVEVTNAAGCSNISPKTTYVINICRESENVNSAYNFTAGPNPFNDYILIEKNGNESVLIVVYDANGKLVETMHTSEQTIELGKQWGAGIYFVRVLDPSNLNGVKNFTLVKK